MATTTPRALDLETVQLASGKHSPDHTFCVMEAVAYVAGEPWSDHPKCADPVITGYCIRLNDRWDDKHRQQLKPYILRLVGTRSTRPVEIQRAWMLADAAMRWFAPAALEIAGLHKDAALMRALPEVTAETSAQARAVARTARKTAAYAAATAVADAAYVAAYAAYAYDAAAAAAYADDAAYAAAAAAADAADAAYAAAYAAYAYDAAAAYVDAAAAAAAAVAARRKKTSPITIEQIDRYALDLLDRLIDLKVPQDNEE